MKAQGKVKFCPSCKKDLPLTAFGKNKRRSDGLTVYCKECRNKRQRDKYAESEEERERKRQYRIQWYAEHKEEQKARVLNWYRKKWQDPSFREQERERCRRYDQSERRKVLRRKWIEGGGQRRYYKQRMLHDPKFRRTRRAYNLKYAHQRRALSPFPQEQWDELLERTGYQCLCCGSQDRIECDHIVPVSKDGTNDIANLQPLCRSCNSSKGARHQMNYLPDGTTP